MTTTYHVLLMAHLLCVIGGFGTLAYNGLYLSLARRRGPAGLDALEVNRQVSGLAELLVYGTFIFGIAAVGSSHVTGSRHSLWTFGQAWVWLSLVGFIVDVGILHGVIKTTQRRYVGLNERLVAAGSASPPRTTEVAELGAMEKRISLGWGAFNLIVVAVVYLMVFQPGR